MVPLLSPHSRVELGQVLGCLLPLCFPVGSTPCAPQSGQGIQEQTVASLSDFRLIFEPSFWQFAFSAQCSLGVWLCRTNAQRQVPVAFTEAASEVCPLVFVSLPALLGRDPRAADLFQEAACALLAEATGFVSFWIYFCFFLVTLSFPCRRGAVGAVLSPPLCSSLRPHLPATAAASGTSELQGGSPPDVGQTAVPTGLFSAPSCLGEWF